MLGFLVAFSFNFAIPDYWGIGKSVARGGETLDSDVDLLVIMPTEGSGLRKAAEIMDKICPRIPVDLIVRDPYDVQCRLESNDFFLKEVMDKGKILYESTDE
jgi:predicted nucleotidyltransferase